jgi:hypothetical protein
MVNRITKDELHDLIGRDGYGFQVRTPHMECVAMNRAGLSPNDRAARWLRRHEKRSKGKTKASGQ